MFPNDSKVGACLYHCYTKDLSDNVTDFLSNVTLAKSRIVDNTSDLAHIVVLVAVLVYTVINVEVRMVL